MFQSYVLLNIKKKDPISVSHITVLVLRYFGDNSIINQLNNQPSKSTKINL